MFGGQKDTQYLEAGKEKIIDDRPIEDELVHALNQIQLDLARRYAIGVNDDFIKKIFKISNFVQYITLTVRILPTQKTLLHLRVLRSVKKIVHNILNTNIFSIMFVNYFKWKSFILMWS